MDTAHAVILGIVQGITEFLPISSTGHLILFGSVLGDGQTLAFDAMLHLATVAAVIVYFWADISLLFQTFLRLLGRQPVDQKYLLLFKALIIGTIPAVIFGLLLEDIMGTLFRNPLLVAGVLVLGSVLFMYAEHTYHTSFRDGRIDMATGLKVGFFQTLALIPGMSRSGSAIAGGMILGLSRSEATRFSFLLAIPVLLGGGAKKALELGSTSGTDWGMILAGAVVAFVVGLGAIHFMVSFVKNHSLWPFIWYRIVVAGVVVAVVFLG
ncbi:undecaprenyl-diphosphatase UppP [Candidatus Kaiserbacteria bacterium]|nr:undecaprenyl-diphosphatase UppP [Candidatus Kaiserbacteria bacterium]